MARGLDFDHPPSTGAASRKRRLPGPAATDMNEKPTGSHNHLLVIVKIRPRIQAKSLSLQAKELGDSLTVEQRTLTPLVLVRIQVPQPTHVLAFPLARARRPTARSKLRTNGIRGRLYGGTNNRGRMSQFSAGIAHVMAAGLATLLAGCSSLPARPGTAKPSADDLGLNWNSTGFPTSLQRFEDDREKCLAMARRSAPETRQSAQSSFSDAFTKCFREAGYAPNEPRRFLQP
jgi:hypothetical protein